VASLGLTFDDGPDPWWTPRVLDALGGAGARATFFPIAPRAEAHPELIARMLRESHIVGFHCDEHLRHSEHDAGWVMRDAARGLERLAAIGVRPTLWRTPWGDVAPWSRLVAAHVGLHIVGWTADTHDWRDNCAADMLEHIGPGLVSGAVVLAHDGLGPGALRSDCAQTVGLIRRVARVARERGLALTALGAGAQPDERHEADTAAYPEEAAT
jgi:peptidoglycan-N-acetylglucosamine deacetylase